MRAPSPTLVGALVAALPLLPLLQLRAQTVDDALLVAPRHLRTTVEYGHDAWDEYWEGSLRRTNGNIGTLTTRSVTTSVAVGLSERLSVVAALPYVWTEASQGVLSGLRGRQDLTVVAKYALLRAPVAGRATLRALAVGGVGLPTSDYTPDFLPLSIGLASRRLISRAALHLHDRSGLFAEGTAGRVWRANVTLDRPAYFTDGQLVLSDRVAMPDVATYDATVGYQRGRWCVPVGVSVQRTLGGGDIRRQDMPFVSNRMNHTRAHAMAMYTLPVPGGVALGAGAMRVLDGRNVGRSTTLTAGVTHAFGF